MTRPITTTLPAPRTGWRRVLRWIRNGVLAILMVVGLWLVQRLYFIATPEAPTPERLALDERVQAGNVDSDGGLLLMGLLAPADMDPVAYGRCLLEAERVNWARSMAIRDDQDQISDQQYDLYEQADKEAKATCAEGKVPLASIKIAVEGASKRMQTPAGRASLASTPIAPVLLQRFTSVMDSPSRSLRTDSLHSPGIHEGIGTLISISAAISAKNRIRWDGGERQTAEQDWQHLFQGWTAFANDSLIYAMIAVRAQTDLLRSLPLQAEGSQQATTEDWAALIALTRHADELPKVIVNAIENERVFTSGALATVDVEMSKRSNWERWLFAPFYDQSATSNRHAAMILRAAQNARLGAMGQTVDNEHQTSHRRCSGFPLISENNPPLCALLGRNGIGMILMSVAEPAYGSYGTRIADLRNLAAATRLTIEARRQGLQGEALAHFVAEAPENMRDIFSKAPFAYDPSQRQLTIRLREKSTVLGEGSYTLSL
jgi:hypothetical protein